MAPKRARSGEGAANTNVQKRAGAAVEWRKKAPNIPQALEMFLLVSRAREGIQNSAKINKKLTEFPKNRSKRQAGGRARRRQCRSRRRAGRRRQRANAETRRRQGEGECPPFAEARPKGRRRGGGAPARPPISRTFVPLTTLFANITACKFHPPSAY